MFHDLSILLAAAFSVRSVLSQVTNVTCGDQFVWMYNTLEQNPCLMSAYAQGACTTDGDWNVFNLPGPSDTYLGPTTEQATVCTCGSVSYSFTAACAYCQGGEVLAWIDWIFDCTNQQVTNNGTYPHAIPNATLFPAWAYIQVESAWDVIQAQKIVQENEPESSPVVPSATSSSSILQSTSSAITTSSGANSTSPSATSGAATIMSTKSNTGVIVGSVVGGTVGLALIAALVFVALRWQRKQEVTTVAQSYESEPPVTTGSAPGQEKYAAVPYSPSPGSPAMSAAPMRLYDPSDPSTFPSAVQLSTPGSATMSFSSADITYTPGFPQPQNTQNMRIVPEV